LLLDRAAGQSFGVLVDPGQWPPRVECLKRLLALLLLACLAGFSALAHASPPDPLWLAGLYDNADYDDVVALLSDTTAVGTSPLLTIHRAHPVLSLLPSGATPAPHDASFLAFHLRSPPSA
jgi:hypothetical protein